VSQARFCEPRSRAPTNSNSRESLHSPCILNQQVVWVLRHWVQPFARAQVQYLFSNSRGFIISLSYARILTTRRWRRMIGQVGGDIHVVMKRFGLTAGWTYIVAFLEPWPWMRSNSVRNHMETRERVDVNPIRGPHVSRNLGAPLTYSLIMMEELLMAQCFQRSGFCAVDRILLNTVTQIHLCLLFPRCPPLLSSDTPRELRGSTNRHAWISSSGPRLYLRGCFHRTDS
jgi:hypothetical protein